MASAGANKQGLPEERKADARTRTGDPFITSEVLYQLSYVGAGRLRAFNLSFPRTGTAGRDADGMFSIAAETSRVHAIDALRAASHTKHNRRSR
jgi:hypothetical protein